MHKKSGLSLTETLITLGVIATLSSLVIPNIIADTQEKQAMVQLKQSYSMITKAFNTARVKNGDTVVGMTESELSDALAGELLISKQCSATDSSCWHANGAWKWFNGTAVTTGSGIGTLLSNGMIIKTRIYDKTCSTTDKDGEPMGHPTCGKLWVDINGWNSPNTVGRDIFLYTITERSIYPGGTQGSRFEDTVCDYDSPSSFGISCTRTLLENK